MRVLAPDQIEALASALDQRSRAWVLFASYSGLRAREIFGLRRARFNPLQSQVEVREELLDVNR